MSSPEVVKYQDPKSILLVNHNGNLRQLYCPFRVQCIQEVELIPEQTFVFVDAVFLHKKHLLLYWINQRLYGYHHFRIEIHY